MSEADNVPWYCIICLLYFEQDTQVAHWTIDVQDFHKILSQCAIYAQDLRKIVLLYPMHNICARFVQDCTSLSNAQDLRKIILVSSMRNICTTFVQDCTYFSNVQYMHKICTRLYSFF